MTQPPRGLPPELDPRRGGARRSAQGPRFLSVVAAVLSALVLAGTVTGYGFYRYYDSQLNRILIRLPGGTTPQGTSGAQNFLLVGSDSRAGVQPGFAGGPQENHGKFGLSDTVILAHVPADGKATLVSFPRDSWVEIPAYRSGGTVIPAHPAKINTAFSEGGPPLLVQVIENLSGLRIDHFVDVDFVGFMNMVNALGGITLCIGTSRHDVLSGDFLTAGVHHVNGEQALAFVRDRHAFANEDFSRIKDQQYFLSVVLKTVLSAGTLTNPFKLNAFLSAASKSVTLDADMTVTDMKNLALRLRHIDPAHVTFVTLPVANSNYLIDGVDAVQLDMAGVHRLFAQLKNTGSSKAGTSVRRVQVDPSSVSVQVLNGAGIPGLASRAAAELRTDRFVVTSIGNAATGGATGSVVRYRPGDKAAAQALAAAVQGPVTVMADPSAGSTLVLVLGSQYAGIRSVQGPGGAPAPHPGGSGPPATPAPQTSPTNAAQPACAP